MPELTLWPHHRDVTFLDRGPEGGFIRVVQNVDPIARAQQLLRIVTPHCSGCGNRYPSQTGYIVGRAFKWRPRAFEEHIKKSL